MSKTKTPLLSFGSQGSIGNTLTTQKLGAQTLVRAKPKPTGAASLHQVYQRWLYQDYKDLWQIQTPATRAEYRAAGVKYHLTAFQYWMRYNLANLPDLAAGYHLDYVAAAAVKDFSRNSVDGTVIGASIVEGYFDNCLTFDGINDKVDFGNPLAIQFTGDVSIEFWFKPLEPQGVGTLVLMSKDTSFGANYGHTDPNYRGVFAIHASGAWRHGAGPLAWQQDEWHHFAGVYDGNAILTYKNGLLSASNVVGALDLTISTLDMLLAAHPTLGFFCNCLIDEFKLYKRALSPETVKLHSDRRYPL